MNSNQREVLLNLHEARSLDPPSPQLRRPMQLRHFIDSSDLFPMSAQVPLTLKAQRPCRYCASRKQGCDRLLPTCSRCTS
ncbi:hypothetical protein CI102_11146 [Trichoderma harzianum]|nr:hypothetical protein CI102_11146 [Trichoderma harzianum]